MTVIDASSDTERGSETSERYVVISSDGHCQPEKIPDFRNYLERKYWDDFDAWWARVSQLIEQIFSDNRRYAHNPEVRALQISQHAGHAGLWDPAQRMEDNEASGIVAEVIFPNGATPFRGAFGGPVNDVPMELQKAGIRAYNRWLADYCKTYPGRLAGIALVPIQDIDAAIKEAEWARDNGLFGGVMLSATSITNDYPAYENPVYEPFWAACEALDMPLTSHTGGGVPDLYQNVAAVNHALVNWEVHYFAIRSLWAMIFSGVFERHPNLRLTFTENFCGWAARVPGELDSLWQRNTFGKPVIEGLHDVVPRKPSTYWAKNCYVGASMLSRAEAEERELVGTDRIMWGSDYPHTEGCWPNVIESLRQTMAGLPEADVRMMLGENAAQCYGFDMKQLGEIAANVGPTVESLNEPLTEKPANTQAHMGYAFREAMYS